MSASLRNRVRRLELSLSASDCETLEEIVTQSYLRAGPIDVAALEAACIASLSKPTIPKGRPGWLYQLILRSIAASRLSMETTA